VGGVKLDRLVKSPLQKYSHLSGENAYLTMHLKNAFHEDCASKARAFAQTMRSKTGDVAQQLNSVAAQQRKRNRRELERIIKAITFHGRLGIPLRGHRDCGNLSVPDVNGDIDYTQGNLRATLQLMVSCNSSDNRGLLARDLDLDLDLDPQGHGTPLGQGIPSQQIRHPLGARVHS